MTIAYINPVGAVALDPDPYELGLSLCSGMTVGLLGNGYIGAMSFLGYVSEELSPLTPGLGFLGFSKPDNYGVALPVPEETVLKIVEACDAVVTAIGHCGSCTSV